MLDLCKIISSSGKALVGYTASYLEILATTMPKGPGIESPGTVIVAMQWCKVHVTVSTDGSLPEPTKN